jgi:pimeloyl-ACP methyl ester carboxylesterase
MSRRAERIRRRRLGASVAAAIVCAFGLASAFVNRTDTARSVSMPGEELLPTFKSIEAQRRLMEAYEEGLSFWPVEYVETDVETHFGRTHVIMSGNPDGPPLVLLHWFCFNSTIWHRMAGALAERHRLYAVDVIGDMGRSVAKNPPKTDEELALWLEQTLDGLGLTRPSILGFSFGGYVAATFARLRPERINRLILLAPAATLRPFALRFFTTVGSVALLPTQRNLDRFVRKVSDRPEAWEPFMTKILSIAFRGGSIQVKVWPRSLRDEEVRSIRSPILLILGEHEIIYSVSRVISRVQALVPGIRIEILPDCSHAIPIDQPDLAAGAILDFL